MAIADSAIGWGGASGGQITARSCWTASPSRVERGVVFSERTTNLLSSARGGECEDHDLSLECGDGGWYLAQRPHLSHNRHVPLLIDEIPHDLSQDLRHVGQNHPQFLNKRLPGRSNMVSRYWKSTRGPSGTWGKAAGQWKNLLDMQPTGLNIHHHLGVTNCQPHEAIGQWSCEDVAAGDQRLERLLLGSGRPFVEDEIELEFSSGHRIAPGHRTSLPRPPATSDRVDYLRVHHMRGLSCGLWTVVRKWVFGGTGTAGLGVLRLAQPEEFEDLEPALQTQLLED